MKKCLHMLFLFVAILAANQACWIVAYQPEMPDCVKNYDRLHS